MILGISIFGSMEVAEAGGGGGGDDEMGSYTTPPAHTQVGNNERYWGVLSLSLSVLKHTPHLVNIFACPFR